MASTSDIKNGLCIKHNNDLFKIIEFLHVKPGKGPAFVRTKLKNLENNENFEPNFKMLITFICFFFNFLINIFKFPDYLPVIPPSQFLNKFYNIFHLSFDS